MFKLRLLSSASIMVISPLHRFRVYLKQLGKGWGQILKSWVSKSEMTHVDVPTHNAPLFLVATNSLILPQYIFMFQVPWLPELVFSMRDYTYLAAVFRGRHSVSKAWLVCSPARGKYRIHTLY